MVEVGIVLGNGSFQHHGKNTWPRPGRPPGLLPGGLDIPFRVPPRRSSRPRCKFKKTPQKRLAFQHRGMTASCPAAFRWPSQVASRESVSRLYFLPSSICFAVQRSRKKGFYDPEKLRPMPTRRLRRIHFSFSAPPPAGRKRKVAMKLHIFLRTINMMRDSFDSFRTSAPPYRSL